MICDNSWWLVHWWKGSELLVIGELTNYILVIGESWGYIPPHIYTRCLKWEVSDIFVGIPFLVRNAKLLKHMARHWRHALWSLWNNREIPGKFWWVFQHFHVLFCLHLTCLRHHTNPVKRVTDHYARAGRGRTVSIDYYRRKGYLK